MYTSENTASLGRLGRGQAAKVLGLDPAAGEAMRRRFQDLGLIPGTRVECLGRSPLGDPCAYLIRGAVIAMRRTDAENISVGDIVPAREAGMLASQPGSRERVADYGTL